MEKKAPIIVVSFRVKGELKGTGGVATSGIVSVYFANIIAEGAKFANPTPIPATVAPVPTAITPSPTPTLAPAPQGWNARIYAYDPAHPHAVKAVSSNQWAVGSDQLSVGSYQYDENGNMTCRAENGQFFKQSYNAENRISAIVKRDGSCDGTIIASWYFAYDGDGTHTTTAHFTGDKPESASVSAFVTAYYFGGAYEAAGTGAIDKNDKITFTIDSSKKYYSFAGQSVAMRDDSGLQYFLSDHLGSVMAITDSSGTLTSQQRYLPFGGVRADVQSPNLPSTDLGYTGQRELDSQIGLMDYKARFYSSALGRFVQPDTLIPSPSNPQSFNRYSYVKNNPVNFNDPSGHCSPSADDWCFHKEENPVVTPPLPPSGGGGGNGGGGNGGNSSATYGPPAPSLNDILRGIPRAKTLHPLEGNTVRREPIYDYSYYPPKIVGYRITSYAYDDYHIDTWQIPGLVLPIPDLKKPVSFTNADIAYSYGVTPIVKYATKQLAGLGLAVTCTPCGGAAVVLKIGSAVETINSMVSFDTHLRTHDVYFTIAPFDTPETMHDKLHKIP